MARRILLVDDHEVFLEGLQALLEAEPDLEIVACASDGRQALAKIRETAPELVIMDLSMPGMNGLEAIRRIAAERLNTRVLCLSAHSDPRFIEEAFRSGAQGYLLKNNAFREVVRAVHAITNGQTYICPVVTGVLVDCWKSASGRQPVAATASRILTRREREVLQLIAEGFPTASIAEQLHVSVKTVGTHRRNIMEKTGIESVAGLTKYAVMEGLTELHLRAQVQYHDAPDQAPHSFI